MSKNLPDYWYTWAWTPERCSQSIQEDSPIVLPDRYSGDFQEGAIAHFSRLEESGTPINWLWLFEIPSEAISLRVAPSLLSDDDPMATLIEATLPQRIPNSPSPIGLIYFPRKWLREIDLSEIQEVWLGFDYHQLPNCTSLHQTSQRYSLEEFMQYAACA